MFASSTAMTNDLPNLLGRFPLPLLILSSNKTVIVATEAVKKLFARSADQWHQRPLIGSSLAELGVRISVEEGCEEQDLDAMLDQIACTHTNTAATTPYSSELTGGNNPRKRGREDLELSSTPGDTAWDVWSDDDFCNPALAISVTLRHSSQNRSFIRAKLSVRMWFTGESMLYVLTLAKPTVSTASANSSIKSQTVENDLGKAKKRATLARMKNCAFDQSSIPSYLFSADETIYYPNQAGNAFAGLMEEDNMLERASQILTQFEVWDENYTRKLPVDECEFMLLFKKNSPCMGLSAGDSI